MKIETSNFSETLIKNVKERKIEKMTSDVESKENKILETSNILSHDKEVLNIDTGGISALSSIKG